MPSQSNQIQIGSHPIQPNQIVVQANNQSSIIQQNAKPPVHQILIQKQVSPHQGAITQTVSTASQLLKSSSVTVTQATVPATINSGTSGTNNPAPQVQVQLKTIPTPPKSVPATSTSSTTTTTSESATNETESKETKQTDSKENANDDSSNCTPNPPTAPSSGSSSHVIQMIPAMDPAKIVQEDVEPDWLWVCDWRGCPK